MRKQAKLAKGRFTGDPSYEYEHVEIKKIYGEGDEVQEEEETVCTVIMIDKMLLYYMQGRSPVCINFYQLVTFGHYMGISYDQLNLALHDVSFVCSIQYLLFKNRFFDILAIYSV